MLPQNGAATDGRGVPAEGPTAGGSRFRSLALTARAFRKRGSLPLAAFLLGVGAFALTLGVVISSFLQSREDAKQRYLQTTNTQVRMLATAIDQGRKDTWDQVRKSVAELWMQAGPWWLAPDQHFVIVDNKDGNVILNIAAYRSGDPASSDADVRATVVALREQIGFSSMVTSPVRYMGEFRSETGQEMLGSFL